jgi:D-amino-acid dehydrogenase
MSADAQHTLVIGGGVIGIACAHYLHQAGHRVTVIDRGRIGGACSHGNCGFVCPSHVLPMAEPGAIKSAIPAMLKPGGALRIRPRLDRNLWRWLWNFRSRCNRDDMLASGRAIQPLLLSSLDLYEELIESESLDCEWQKRGLLYVYRDPVLLESYRATNELTAAEFNESARHLDGQQLVEFEPGVKNDLAGAWFFEHDAHLRPDRLIASWRSRLEADGVRFIEGCTLTSLEVTDGRVRAAGTSGETISADTFVIATGAWTPQLEHLLGLRIPIEPGKGYSLIVPRPPHSPRVPIIFPEHRVAITPFEAGMRIGSTMEFAGYDESIRPARLKQLTDGASHYMRDPIPNSFTDPWYGWRPMTYDSTPVIGRCPGRSNVFLATGHNMLGLSMAPATGRLVSELIMGSEPHLETGCYAAERFLR